MKKYILDFTVADNARLNSRYALIKITPADGSALPEICAGQFVQVAVPDAPHTFLRRPISVNNVDRELNQIWLLVRMAGEGTERLAALERGAKVNIMLPLGNVFPLDDPDGKILLVGGGVGIAPLFMLGKELKSLGRDVTYLVGARSESDLLLIEELKKIAPVEISTDDGSVGTKGIVTLNPAWDKEWKRIYCCGPAPMMKGVASIARKRGIECFVSLENMMACGLGACLCCVEKTVRGNVCVCTEGPIFNINELTWHD